MWFVGGRGSHEFLVHMSFLTILQEAKQQFPIAITLYFLELSKMRGVVAQIVHKTKKTQVYT